MKKLLIIFCLLLIGATNAQIRNSYGTISGGMKQISGATVTDLVSANNGTIAGTNPSAPVVSANGYVTFVGNATAGDRGRIEIPNRTDFDYNYNGSYSFVIIFKTTKSDASAHSLLTNTASPRSPPSFYMGLEADEKINTVLNPVQGQAKSYNSNTAKNNGLWHVYIITYSTNSLSQTVDGVTDAVKFADNAITSGAFYGATSKATIAASWANATSNYIESFTGSIALVQNYNNVLNLANIADINNEFNLLY